MWRAQDGPEGSKRWARASHELGWGAARPGGAWSLSCGGADGVLLASFFWIAFAAAGCGGTLDAGRNRPVDAGDAGTVDASDGGSSGSDASTLRDASEEGDATALRDASEADLGALRDTGPYDVTETGEAQGADADAPHGLLPVDERNPIILDNDCSGDNWQGEFAVLLAHSGGPELIGIVVGATSYWNDASKNREGWTQFLAAARSSGLRNVPTVTDGANKPLTRPDDGMIDSTSSMETPAAHMIVAKSRQYAQPSRPVVVLTGASLTNVAEAYLLDHSVVDRVVVVASLGRYKAPKGITSGPNGDLDPWADWVVAQRFRFIQLGIDYDQSDDVPAEYLPSLPNNAFGQWMENKQPNVSGLKTAADQITVLAVGAPSFVRAVQRCSPDLSAGFNSPPGQGPPLVPDPTGNAWVVTEFAPPPFGPSLLWQMLLNRRLFGP